MLLPATVIKCYTYIRVTTAPQPETASLSTAFNSDCEIHSNSAFASCSKANSGLITISDWKMIIYTFKYSKCNYSP